MPPPSSTALGAHDRPPAALHWMHMICPPPTMELARLRTHGLTTLATPARSCRWPYGHPRAVPVVLTGDMNAKDCDELAGVARALVRLLSSPTHPLLWSVMDAPTPPTTITEERHLRIDYLLYQSSALTLTGVGHVPRLSPDAPIPDEAHPSDHLPVSARLVLKSHWAQVEDDARQWLACISGTTTVRPLSGDRLRLAFTYFDKDASGDVTAVQLEAGMQTLGFPGLDSNFVRQALREAGCLTDADAPLSRGDAVRSRQLGEDDWAMDLGQFVAVYTYGVQRSSSAMARQLEKAFSTFDLAGSGVLTPWELRDALGRMASAPLDERRLEEVWPARCTRLECPRAAAARRSRTICDVYSCRLAPDSGGARVTRLSRPLPTQVLKGLAVYNELGEGAITIASFSRWMMSTYASYLKDPSLVTDSIGKWSDLVYNQ